MTTHGVPIIVLASVVEGPADLLVVVREAKVQQDGKVLLTGGRHLAAHFRRAVSRQIQNFVRSSVTSMISLKGYSF